MLYADEKDRDRCGRRRNAEHCMRGVSVGRGFEEGGERRLFRRGQFLLCGLGVVRVVRVLFGRTDRAGRKARSGWSGCLLRTLADGLHRCARSRVRSRSTLRCCCDLTSTVPHCLPHLLCHCQCKTLIHKFTLSHILVHSRKLLAITIYTLVLHALLPTNLN